MFIFKFTVLNMMRKQFKILNSIVSSIAVFMVDSLKWLKVSPYMFFHNNSVFKYIVVTTNKGVVGQSKLNISSPAYSLVGKGLPLTFLRAGFGTTLASRVSGIKYFTTNWTFDSMWIIFLCIRVIATIRAKLIPLSFRMSQFSLKTFTTTHTHNNNHNNPLYLYTHYIPLGELCQGKTLGIKNGTLEKTHKREF